MVLSDTEAELGTAQHKDRAKKSDDVTWEWGELPQVCLHLFEIFFAFLKYFWSVKY